MTRRSCIWVLQLDVARTSPDLPLTLHIFSIAELTARTVQTLTRCVCNALDPPLWSTFPNKLSLEQDPSCFSNVNLIPSDCFWQQKQFQHLERRFNTTPHLATSLQASHIDCGSTQISLANTVGNKTNLIQRRIVKRAAAVEDEGRLVHHHVYL